MIGSTNAGGGGSGLSLRVLGGTTQPTNPREGTIWVNTSALKPDYILSGTQPGSSASGLVWIKLGSYGVSLPVDKKGTLAITLIGCAVYNGSTWDNVNAWVYTGGKWVQFNWSIIEIYNAGKEEMAITGGLTVNGYSIHDTHSTIKLAIAQKQADAIFFIGAQGICKLVGTMNPIKLDGYKNLKIVCAASSYSSAYGSTDILRVTVSRDKKIYGNKSNALATKSIDYTNGKKVTANVDVSAISGEAYISVVCPYASDVYSGYLYQLELS